MAIGVGVLSHLAFFEEKKKNGKTGALPWINLGMSYTSLLLGLVSFLFLLLKTPESNDLTIAKAGQVPGQETEGAKIPQSDNTNVASGGERARLGNTGRGEGLDAMGGANEDNQNSMREAQVVNPDIAGAELGTSMQTKVSSQNIKEITEPGEFDQGLSDAQDSVLSRIGNDEENKDVGDPNALIFDEKKTIPWHLTQRCLRVRRIPLILFQGRRMTKFPIYVPQLIRLEFLFLNQ